MLFEHDARDRRIQWMLDRVRERYGVPALLWGECADPNGPYTGAKIAYQSFPDMARLHWLGLFGGDQVSARDARGGGLHRASLGSTARKNSRALGSLPAPQDCRDYPVTANTGCRPWGVSSFPFHLDTSCARGCPRWRSRRVSIALAAVGLAPAVRSEGERSASLLACFRAVEKVGAYSEFGISATGIPSRGTRSSPAGRRRRRAARRGERSRGRGGGSTPRRGGRSRGSSGTVAPRSHQSIVVRKVYVESRAQGTVSKGSGFAELHIKSA